jgi:hypothetical protein
MWTFIVSGALYLVGVAVVLVIKPSFMFTPDGTWKEFGIGKGTEEYTTFPFWMFCLVWAFLAFTIVLFLEPSSPLLPSPTINSRSPYAPYVETHDLNQPELPKGYYVLNKKATALSGVPKYVYLGPEEP